MDDLIRRQDALKAVEYAIFEYADKIGAQFTDAQYSRNDWYLTNTVLMETKNAIIKAISEAPTVDAIPIEAIVERIENENAETDGRYVLAELYMEWRHENDRFDEDDRFNDLPPLEERLPVRHGKWMGTVCTACGESEPYYYDFEYCPHCGAKMDG